MTKDEIEKEIDNMLIKEQLMWHDEGLRRECPWSGRPILVWSKTDELYSELPGTRYMKLLSEEAQQYCHKAFKRLCEEEEYQLKMMSTNLGKKKYRDPVSGQHKMFYRGSEPSGWVMVAKPKH